MKDEESIEVNLAISNVLKTLEDEMIEAKRIWYSHGKQEEWDKMWGITGRHRYEGVREALIKIYQREIIKN